MLLTKVCRTRAEQDLIREEEVKKGIRNMSWHGGAVRCSKLKMEDEEARQAGKSLESHKKRRRERRQSNSQEQEHCSSRAFGRL